MAIEYCGSCEKQIKNNQCGCGFWWDKDTQEAQQYAIFNQALKTYQINFKKGKLPNVISMDLAGDSIQCLFFEGTKQEVDMLKKVLEQVRSLKGQYGQ